MDAITRFEELKCWQAARILTVYDISKQGLLAKDFDLRSQIRRASVSSMSNIAEGFGRFSNREFIRYLEMSQGSAPEVRSISYVIQDQQYLDMDKIEIIRAEAEKAKSLALGLIRYLKRD